MKRNFTLPLFIIVLIVAENSIAQTNTFPSSGAAGIGTTTPNSSSLLEMKSTTKGLLIPRMTQTQRNAIASPAKGLLIYQTNNNPGFYYYDGSAWNNNAYWKKSGTKIFYNSGNVGIGTTTPAYKLDVNGDINLATGNYLRINKVRVLRDNPNSGDNNVFLGDYADTTSSPGFRNTAVGSFSLSVNTGAYNTAYGSTSLKNNTTGTSNTAIGEKALQNNSTGSNNVALGSGALYANTTSSQNVAVGFQSLYSNTDGVQNTAAGYHSLYSNNIGNSNSAFGLNALSNNTTGNNNTATGVAALSANTTGSNNTAYGYFALDHNTADGNTGVGYWALTSNTSGTQNTAIGTLTLIQNTSGFNNTALGSTALLSNTTGNSNTAVGEKALQNNTTGGSNTALGSGALQNNIQASNNTAIGFQALYNTSYVSSNNTAVGYQALYNTASGSQNTAIGYQAGYVNDGSYNIFVGYNSGQNNTTGSENVFMGLGAGVNNTTGSFNTYIGYAAGGLTATNSNNTFYGYGSGSGSKGDNNSFIGYYAKPNSASLYNSSAFGFQSVATQNSQIMLGQPSLAGLFCAVELTVFSDGRYKRNITADVPGLKFINKLRPVTYHLNVHDIDKKLRIAEDKLTTGEADKREKQLRTGFVAQEVEKAANEIGYDFSGVSKPENDSDFYGLRYADFVVPLVKAVQELSKQNDSLKDENASLQSQMNEMKTAIQLLAKKEGVDLSTVDSQQSTVNSSLSSASIAQNVPNPYNHTTSIAYNLPAKFSSAQIVVTDNNGKTLKAINVSGAGKGVLHLDATTLSSGSYNYSFYVDGKLIDTKKMILSK